MDHKIVAGGGLLLITALITASSVGEWRERNRPDTGRVFARPVDPPAGTPIVLPDRDVDGRALHSDGPILIAFMGQCSSCALNAVPPDRIRSSGYARVVLVFHVAKDQMPKDLHRLREPFRTVADSDGALERRLGTSWFPRFVVLDAKRRWVRGQAAPGEIAPYVVAGVRS